MYIHINMYYIHMCTYKYGADAVFTFQTRNPTHAYIHIYMYTCILYSYLYTVFTYIYRAQMQFLFPKQEILHMYIYI
jgi:hypothetical protein